MEIATTDDNGAKRKPHLANIYLQEGRVLTRYFRRNIGFYTVSFSFVRWMKRHARDYDAIHIHALFSHTSVAAGFIAKRQGVTLHCTPHGRVKPLGYGESKALYQTVVVSLVG